jgi:hypothetical protein
MEAAAVRGRARRYRREAKGASCLGSEGWGEDVYASKPERLPWLGLSGFGELICGERDGLSTR